MLTTDDDDESDVEYSSDKVEEDSSISCGNIATSGGESDTHHQIPKVIAAEIHSKIASVEGRVKPKPRVEFKSSQSSLDCAPVAKDPIISLKKESKEPSIEVVATSSKNSVCSPPPPEQKSCKQISFEEHNPIQDRSEHIDGKSSSPGSSVSEKGCIPLIIVLLYLSSEFFVKSIVISSRFTCVVNKHIFDLTNIAKPIICRISLQEKLTTAMPKVEGMPIRKGDRVLLIRCLAKMLLRLGLIFSIQFR